MAQSEATFLHLIDKQNFGMLSWWDMEKETKTKPGERGGGQTWEELSSVITWGLNKKQDQWEVCSAADC